MPVFNDAIVEKLRDLEQKYRLRKLTALDQHEGMYVEHESTRYINFSSNDYLGLAQHASLKSAAINAINHHGIGGTSSRLVTGNHRLYGELEQKLAALKGAESALIFGSGYLANIGVITALAGKNDLIIADKLAHACMIDGAKLAKANGAAFKRFRHNDLVHLENTLQTQRCLHENAYIVTETIFSMDGDAAPVEEILTLCEQYDAMLISDDAHGVYDRIYDNIIPNITEDRDVNKDRAHNNVLTAHPCHIQIGTLSKAFGCYGGYVAAEGRFVDYITNLARTLIFTTLASRQHHRRHQCRMRCDCNGKTATKITAEYRIVM